METPALTTLLRRSARAHSIGQIDFYFVNYDNNLFIFLKNMN